MDRNTLLWLLGKMNKEAQAALSKDGSFLEALQALKWEVDRDARVRAATRALRDRGLSVYRSFVPRVRIRLYFGEMLLDLQRDSAESNSAEAPRPEQIAQPASDPLVQELRDAASSVITASPYCGHLDHIVNEAVQGSRAFEQLAALVERAGFELQICLDLSTYAELHEPGAKGHGTSSTAANHPRHRLSPAKAQPAAIPFKTLPSKPLNHARSSRLPLSALDLKFLKQLQISPD